MRPKFGNMVSVDQSQLVKVDGDNCGQYKYTGNTVVATNGVRCATFADNNGKVYMQPWAIAGRFRRKGELNIHSSLKTDQVREMVRSFVLDKVDISTLAHKYNITEPHCKDIVTGHAWRHVTISLIHQLVNGNTAVPVVVSNKPKAKRKLSASLIPFIRKDKEVNKMTTKAIAKKYCISERHARRILVGEAWKPAAS